MKKYLFLVLLFVCWGYHSSWAQLAYNEPVNKNLLLQADRYFEREAFQHAVALYQKILEQTPQPEVMVKAARCYVKLNNFHNAAFWYKRAMHFEIQPTELWLEFAACQKRLGNYNKADQVYREYLAKFPQDQAVQNFIIDLQILSHEKVQPVEIRKLNLDLGGPAFAPSFWNGGLVVVASGNTGGFAKGIAAWSEQPYYDLYFVPLSDNTARSSKYFDRKINSIYHEGPAVFLENGERIIFTRSCDRKSQQKRNLKLMTAYQKKNGKWGKAKPLKINQKNVSMGHPALSSDGKTLFFVSNAPGGYGGTDLYRSRWSENGWQQPENLGPQINSSGDELFPTVNNRHLFFSSNGKGGYGGLDIWVYDLDQPGKPKNAGQPFNSKHDDFGLIWDLKANKGYFSSNRKGQDAIYQATR